MFGIPVSPVRRTRNNFAVAARLGSVNRQGAVVDIDMGTSIVKITDSEAKGDSGVSIVSPTLRAALSFDLNATRLFTEIRFASSSLDYSSPTQSSSIFGFTAGSQWRIGSKFLFNVGGLYHHGSADNGEERTLVAPIATLTWEKDPDRVWSFWYKPEIWFLPYDELSHTNPYLVRELNMRPERIPVNVGSTLQCNSPVLSIEMTGSFAHSQDHAVEVADSGRIRLSYVDADVVTLRATGTLIPSGSKRLIFSGTVQPNRQVGTTTQLPMTPLVKLSLRGEADLRFPLTFWTSIDYRSKCNADIAGTRTLADVARVDAGVSTNVIPRLALSFSIANLFNTAYEWWSGYVAPGRQFTFIARMNLK